MPFVVAVVVVVEADVGSAVSGIVVAVAAFGCAGAVVVVVVVVVASDTFAKERVNSVPVEEQTRMGSKSPFVVDELAFVDGLKRAYSYHSASVPTTA
jgi:hypothetical protein